jgi:hypothetical protein
MTRSGVNPSGAREIATDRYRLSDCRKHLLAPAKLREPLGEIV